MLDRNIPTFTASSARFTACVLDDQGKRTDGWVETHVHFGRYGAIELTVIVAAPEETFERLTEIVRFEFRQVGLWLLSETGLTKELQAIEIRPVVYLNGKRRAFVFVHQGNALTRLLDTDWKEFPGA